MLQGRRDGLGPGAAILGYAGHTCLLAITSAAVPGPVVDFQLSVGQASGKPVCPTSCLYRCPFFAMITSETRHWFSVWQDCYYTLGLLSPLLSDSIDPQKENSRSQ